METLVQGASLTSPTFQAALHAALRTLIDKLGVYTFNVAISGIRLLTTTDSSGSQANAGSSPGRVTARSAPAHVAGSSYSLHACILSHYAASS